MTLKHWLACACVVASMLAGSAAPKHFIFFSQERGRMSEASFLDAREITGAQLKYTWRELEPERDRYNLRPVLDDLAHLEKHGKRLFVQLQDVSFSEAVLVPDYLLRDPEFHGGAASPEGPAKTTATLSSPAGRRAFWRVQRYRTAISPSRTLRPASG